MGTGNVFFYADDDSAHYDELHLLTDPDYAQMHGALSSQVQYWLNTFCNNSLGQPLVLDLGCGTGIEGINLLSQHCKSKVVAIDISRAMLDIFKSKVTKLLGSSFSDNQCYYHQADLLNSGWASESLEKSGFKPNLFSVAITVYVLHHFTARDKLAIYKEIYDNLAHGGVFFNADLYSYQSEWLSRHAQNRVESWITKEFDQAKKDPTGYSIKDPKEWDRLRDGWISHVKEENQPIPATDARQNSALSDQQLLFEAGFKYVDCTFRSGQAGILCAQKID